MPVPRGTQGHATFSWEIHWPSNYQIKSLGGVNSDPCTCYAYDLNFACSMKVARGYMSENFSYFLHNSSTMQINLITKTGIFFFYKYHTLWKLNCWVIKKLLNKTSNGTPESLDKARRTLSRIIFAMVPIPLMGYPEVGMANATINGLPTDHKLSCFRFCHNSLRDTAVCWGPFISLWKQRFNSLLYMTGKNVYFFRVWLGCKVTLLSMSFIRHMTHNCLFANISILFFCIFVLCLKFMQGKPGQNKVITRILRPYACLQGVVFLTKFSCFHNSANKILLHVMIKLEVAPYSVSLSQNTIKDYDYLIMGRDPGGTPIEKGCG